MIGFGLCEKPAREQAHTLDGHIANLVSLVRQLDLTRVTVVRHDWGGPTGLCLAMSNPSRVRTIVNHGRDCVPQQRARADPIRACDPRGERQVVAEFKSYLVDLGGCSLVGGTVRQKVLDALQQIRATGADIILFRAARLPRSVLAGDSASVSSDTTNCARRLVRLFSPDFSTKLVRALPHAKYPCRDKR
jgi:pimeloyl-ACP methyl ester carboxylesterase